MAQITQEQIEQKMEVIKQIKVHIAKMEEHTEVGMIIPTNHRGGLVRSFSVMYQYEVKEFITKMYIENLEREQQELKQLMDGFINQ